MGQMQPDRSLLRYVLSLTIRGTRPLLVAGGGARGWQAVERFLVARRRRTSRRDTAPAPLSICPMVL
jgi:hypothetical protein